MLRRSSGVSPTETAPMFPSWWFNFVVPGIGTIHGAPRQEPSERDLRGWRLVARRRAVNPGCEAVSNSGPSAAEKSTVAAPKSYRRYTCRARQKEVR
jgi:hypothetical protein